MPLMTADVLGQTPFIKGLTILLPVYFYLIWILSNAFCTSTRRCYNCFSWFINMVNYMMNILILPSYIPKINTQHDDVCLWFCYIYTRDSTCQYFEILYIYSWVTLTYKFPIDFGFSIKVILFSNWYGKFSLFCY